MGSQRARQDWSDWAHVCVRARAHTHTDTDLLYNPPKGKHYFWITVKSKDYFLLLDYLQVTRNLGTVEARGGLTGELW